MRGSSYCINRMAWLRCRPLQLAALALLGYSAVVLGLTALARSLPVLGLPLLCVVPPAFVVAVLVWSLRPAVDLCQVALTAGCQGIWMAPLLVAQTCFRESGLERAMFELDSTCGDCTCALEFIARSIYPLYSCTKRTTQLPTSSALHWRYCRHRIAVPPWHASAGARACRAPSLSLPSRRSGLSSLPSLAWPLTSGLPTPAAGWCIPPRPPQRLRWSKHGAQLPSPPPRLPCGHPQAG